MPEQSETNTEFKYRYRDASNYKWTHAVIIAGTLTLEDIRNFLIDGEYFIPQLVGMKSLTPDLRNEDDHDWHEIISLRPTIYSSNFTSSAELLRRFQSQSHMAWTHFPMEWRLG